MNLLLFIITLAIAFIVVRIGAIAFQLTGLEWSLAKFQALSCFTGTGFTTKEAELIVNNPQRRRIASILMVLGNAGLVTLIATFANSLRPAIRVPKINIPFLHFVFPASLLPWINLLIIIIGITVIYRVFTHNKTLRKLTDILRKQIIKKEVIKPVSFAELSIATGGYGISRIDICENSPILNKKLAEAELRKYNLTILTLEREGEVITNPSADIQFLLHDKVVVFGKLEEIRTQLCPLPLSANTKK